MCIGDVYVNQVRILCHPSLSLNLPRVLSISRNCLAPPHVPESRIARFIPQCIYSPHLSLYLREFVSYICVVYSCCLLN